MAELSSGGVHGIANFTVQATDHDEKPMTTVTLSSDIKGQTFVYVLQFLYTGLTRCRFFQVCFPYLIG